MRVYLTLTCVRVRVVEKKSSAMGKLINWQFGPISVIRISYYDCMGYLP